jgi:diacylglycerol kinase
VSQGRRSGSRLASFRHAFDGWWHAIRTQRNAWIHLLATVLVLGVGWWLRVEPVGWALLFLAMGLVWVAELANTALEALSNLTSPEPHPLIRVAKDVAAAAVLAAALTAAAVGAAVLGPPLWGRVMGR